MGNLVPTTDEIVKALNKTSKLASKCLRPDDPAAYLKNLMTLFLYRTKRESRSSAEKKEWSEWRSQEEDLAAQGRRN